MINRYIFTFVFGGLISIFSNTILKYFDEDDDGDYEEYITSKKKFHFCWITENESEIYLGLFFNLGWSFALILNIYLFFVQDV
jgi:hypothetical protein